MYGNWKLVEKQADRVARRDFVGMYWAEIWDIRRFRYVPGPVFKGSLCIKFDAAIKNCIDLRY